MRLFIKKETGIIHACLIFAFFVPAVYAFLTNRSQRMQQEIFIIGFWILVPLILTQIVAEKCKSLWSYLLCNFMILIVSILGALVWTQALENKNVSLGFIITIAMETIVIIWDRFMGRLSNREKEETKQQENPNWQPRYNVLEKPSFYMLGYFLIIYLIGLNTDSPILCNQVLFATILYSIVTLVYQFIDKTQTYFSINERVCNLPTKRIYGIKSMILLGFLGVLLIFTLATVTTTDFRQYHDIRKWTTTHPLQDADIKQTPDIELPLTDPMEDIKEQTKASPKAPKWLDYMFDGIGAAVLLILFISIIKAIQQSAKNFRNSYDENGDLIESLEGESLFQRKKHKQTREEDLSPREKIRKEYRQHIRKYKKELPDSYDSPYEIESKAGIEKESTTQEIHTRYEQARYDREE